MADTINQSTTSEINTLMNATIAMEVITSICIIIISLPQLYKVLKERKTGNISFTSFWFYHLGIFLWIFFAAFASGRDNWLSTMISEFIALLVNSIVMFYLYYYKENKISLDPTKRPIIPKLKYISKELWYVMVGLTVLNIISIVFLIIYFTLPNAVWGDTANLVISLIIPAGVTLPFTPQLIKSFKTKQWQGVSYWLYILYTVNNIAWIAFFILWMKINDLSGYGNGGNIGGLVWQAIAFVLFGIQLVFTIDDAIRRKKGLRIDTVPLNKNDVVEMLVD